MDVRPLGVAEAQERLDAKSEDEIGQAIQNLAALARKLRAQRFEDAGTTAFIFPQTVSCEGF